MRIIAGTAKGHTIKAPKGMATRPTQDRVRESIFNVLSNYVIHGKKVLDFFAGTGAFAIESVSRGASEAVAVDKATVRIIRENVAHCRMTDSVQVLPVTIQKAGKLLAGQQFDFIFSDPPYEKGMVQETLDCIIAHDLLSQSGILILERHNEEPLVLPEGWECIREQKFGYTRVNYCVRK